VADVTVIATARAALKADLVIWFVVPWDTTAADVTDTDAVEDLMEVIAAAVVVATALIVGHTSLFVAKPMELRKRIPPTVVAHNRPRAVMVVVAFSQIMAAKVMACKVMAVMV